MVEILFFAHSWYVFNFFVSIYTTGGYTEWNINSDKLILEWLANCTPPSCIQVNIISMTMANNPNPEVASMIHA